MGKCFAGEEAQQILGSVPSYEPPPPPSVPLSTVQTFLKDWREWLGDGKERVPMRNRSVEEHALGQRFYRLQEKFQAQQLSDADVRLLCGVPCLKEVVEKHMHPSQSEVQQVLAALTRWQESHPDEELGRRTETCSAKD